MNGALSAFGVPACTGYGSACFDGRSVYFAGFEGNTSAHPTTVPHGFIARYDTNQGAFSSTSSWEAYNVAASVSAAASGFLSCLTDGQNVYFIPDLGTVLASYQIGPTLSTLASWTTVDLATVGVSNTGHFAGATLVGRYLYLVPWGDATPGNAKESIVARYDTRAPGGLAATASWATFDLTTIGGGTTLAKGYQGAVTDGIRIYFVPAYNGASIPPFVIYDSRSDFRSAASWTTMGGSTTTPTALKVQSAYAASDGVYGYLSPNWDWNSNAVSGKIYRWRLTPGLPDAQVPQLGMSQQFWLDSSGYVGFGTSVPADQVHSAGNVRADGLLLGQLGTSNQYAQAITTAYVASAQSLSGTMSPWTLASYTLPASAFSAVNKGVRLNAFGTFASGSTHNRQVLVTFGGTTIVLSPVVNTTGSWFLEAAVLCSAIGGSPAQVAGSLVVATTSGGATPSTSYTTINAALGSGIAIVVASSSVASTDIVLNGYTVDFIN